MRAQEQSGQPLFTKDFILITIINLLIFLGFQMLMPTFPVYIKKLGGGDSIIGVVAGIFTLSSLIGRPLAGRALDRIGRREVFLIGLGIIILTVLFYNWLPTILLILIFRLIHGFGWGVSSTSSSTIASDIIPKERFGEGMGYFSLASSLAMAIAPAVGLMLIVRFSFDVLFFISAGLMALAAVLTLLVRYRQVEKPQGDHAKAALYEYASVRPAVVIFFVSVTYGSIVSFLPLYAAQRGIQNIGLFFTMYALSLIISRPAFGRVVDRKGYDYAVVPGLLCIAVTLVLLWQAASLTAFIVAAILYGIGFGAVQSSLQTMAVANVPRHRRGAANATFFTGFDSGIGLGAMALGAVASIVGYSAMYLWGVVSIIVAFILYFTIAKKRSSELS